MLVSRRPGALTSWGSALIRGEALPDHVDAAVTDGDALHRVVGVPEDPEPATISVALGRLRVRGVTGLRLVLPEPGDPTGLPGPAMATAAATEAGAAVLTVGAIEAPALALVPTSSPSEAGDVVRWDAIPIDWSPPPHGLPTLGEADRMVAEAMREATQVLEGLDVARGRDALQARLIDVDRGLRRLDVPPSLPARAQRLVVTGSRLLAIVTIAAESDGAAVTAASAVQRAHALRPLRRAARYALCAGYSALADPTADPLRS